MGSAVAEQLLQNDEPVTIVSRDAEKAGTLKRKGAEVSVIDIRNTTALHNLFLKGHSLFLLNPPAPPATDTVAEEKKTLYSILEALKDSAIKKVVAQSTYGARPGEGQGDLNVLYEMEKSLQKMDLSVSIIRAAYYMSNWDGYLESVKESGQLHSFFPKDLAIPMVAPKDLGTFAARLMTEPLGESQLYHVEGPQTYSASDVASAFAAALNKSVDVVELPESAWKETFKSVGFSESAADSYAAMTRITLEGDYEKPTEPVRGSTTIQKYIGEVVGLYPMT